MELSNSSRAALKETAIKVGLWKTEPNGIRENLPDTDQPASQEMRSGSSRGKRKRSVNAPETPRAKRVNINGSNSITLSPLAIPKVETRQTHQYVDLAKAIEEHKRQFAGIKTKAQESYDAILASHSIVQDGKPYFRPLATISFPLRAIAMIPPPGVAQHLSLAKTKASMIMKEYNRQRAIFDMLANLSPVESRLRTQKLLAQKFHQVVRALTQRADNIDVWSEFKAAQEELRSTSDLGLIGLTARAVTRCLKKQYVDPNPEPQSLQQYWFQNPGYVEQCCAIEAWLFALDVMKKSLNEQVAAVERRVGKYIDAQNRPLSEIKN